MNKVVTLTIVSIITIAIFSYSTYTNYFYAMDQQTGTERSMLLEMSACARAMDLAKTGQWSHENFDDYIWYKNTKIGENLANFESVDGVEEYIWKAWENSPTHKKNLDEFKYAGYCTVDNITVGLYSD